MDVVISNFEIQQKRQSQSSENGNCSRLLNNDFVFLT